MFALCMLSVILNSSDGDVLRDIDIEGRIVKTEAETYTMDFTQGALKYDVVDPNKYKNVIVNKSKCIKE